MNPLLEIHRRHLAAARTETNLVGPGPLDVHYEDARGALRDLRPEGRWADLGSGAGFPGIVFAAMFPSVAVDLVENRRRRVEFLQRVVEASRTVAPRPAPLRVVGRSLRVLPPQTYDGLLARALAKPPVVLDYARRLLVPGGMVVLFLQAEADPPAADDFEVSVVTPYVVDEKRRKSVALVRRLMG
ncbi:MAG: RsmG family class I SAM-dependent methyltransferase [Myxococcota bacterium]